MPESAQTVLDFWFLPEASAGHGAARREWFSKDGAFDRQIGARFGALIRQALAGELPEWAGVSGALARILLLDQFTRNAGRDTAAAFAGDALALAAAQNLVGSGGDLLLPPLQRSFVYMPFEHAEDMAMQERALALFTALCAAAPGHAGMLDYARRHRAIIARFGRFPHRNLILGRPSTPQELEFLRQPGSGF